VYAGVDPLTGKNHYLGETVETRRDAQRSRTRLLSQVDENRNPRTRATLNQLLDRYLEVVELEPDDPAGLRREDREARPAHDRLPACRPARRRDPGAALRAAAEEGTPLELTYTSAVVDPATGQPAVLARDSLTETIHGQQATDSSTLGLDGAEAQTYDYDAAGRLKAVRDTVDGPAGATCTIRAYEFDDATNRTAVHTAGADGDICPAPPSSATRAWTYDAADRHTDTGYAADAFGRFTTVPGADTGSILSRRAWVPARTVDSGSWRSCWQSATKAAADVSRKTCSVTVSQRWSSA
jgi:hypothetical protein